MKKNIPTGVSDFKKIREENFYYVDKTALIEEILEKKSEVTLITRPRRFGKTLNMSTIKYFLDINGGSENRKLFSGLRIEKTKWIDEQGKTPIIFLTMKEAKGKNYKEFFKEFKVVIGDAFEEHKKIREKLDSRNIKIFDRIWNMEEDANYETSLKFLSKWLVEYYGVKPVILIDEYDSPMIEANEYGYYEDVKNLLSKFYGSALKDSECAFAVVTGILRVAKESIFSNLNNLDVSTILTGDFNHFGMTEEEVEKILKHYNLETTLKDTQEWYNGYLFGEKKVYNPWSILKHCSSGKLEAYWINTSGNLLINQILRKADKKINDIFHKLLRSEKVSIILQENMVFGPKYGDNTLLYLMFSAGYLTIEEKGEKRNEYFLKIPNFEVREFFKDTFMDIASANDRSSYLLLEKALVDGNILKSQEKSDSMEELIEDMLKSSMSFLDYDSNDEKNYHNVILGMMVGLDNKFYPFSNRESGLGRYDLALEPKNKSGLAYIFEFKVASSEKEMDKLGKKALIQIEEKLYDREFRNRGIENIKKIGMVFHKKLVKFYMEIRN